MIDPKVQHLENQARPTSKKNHPTLLKKLQLPHPAHTQRHCGKSPTSVPSNIKQTSTNTDKETEGLKNSNEIVETKPKT